MARVARWFLGLVMAACLSGGNSSALAQSAALPYVPHSPYLQIATGDGWKWSPAVAYDPQHDVYLVVWEYWLTNGHHAIYGRLVSATGSMGAEFVVYSGTYYSLQPSVAYDTTHGHYLVVWSYDSTGDGSDHDIYGRFIPWNGPNPNETDFIIDSSRDNSVKPRVVYAVTPDEFFMVWKVEATPSYINEGIIHDNKSGITKTISTDGLVDDHPDVAYNQMRNEFLAVWDADVSRVTYDLDIHGIRLGWDGTPQTPSDFVIADLAFVEERPTVGACYSADQYFIAWQSWVSSIDTNIYGRFMSGNGTMDPIYGYAGTTLPQRNARLACNPAGNEYILTWDDEYAQPYPRIGIWAELLNTQKAIMPPYAFEVVRPSATMDRTLPAVAYGGSKVTGRTSALVVWQHGRDNSIWTDIWGQIIYPHEVFLPLIRR